MNLRFLLWFSGFDQQVLFVSSLLFALERVLMADYFWRSVAGKRSQQGVWDCVVSRECGFKSKFTWREACRACVMVGLAVVSWSLQV